MTTTSAPPDSATQPVAAAALTPSPASSLLTPALLLLGATNALAMLSFYLLLTVVPTYAVTLGLGGVGAVTVAGAMMLAAELCEFGIEWAPTIHRVLVRRGISRLRDPGHLR